jgi:hypothetical protein
MLLDGPRGLTDLLNTAISFSNTSYLCIVDLNLSSGPLKSATPPPAVTVVGEETSLSLIITPVPVSAPVEIVGKCRFPAVLVTTGGVWMDRERGRGRVRPGEEDLSDLLWDDGADEDEDEDEDDEDGSGNEAEDTGDGEVDIVDGPSPKVDIAVVVACAPVVVVVVLWSADKVKFVRCVVGKMDDWGDVDADAGGSGEGMDLEDDDCRWWWWCCCRRRWGEGEGEGNSSPPLESRRGISDIWTSSDSSLGVGNLGGNERPLAFTADDDDADGAGGRAEPNNGCSALSLRRLLFRPLLLPPPPPPPWPTPPPLPPPPTAMPPPPPVEPLLLSPSPSLSAPPNNSSKLLLNDVGPPAEEAVEPDDSVSLRCSPLPSSVAVGICGGVTRQVRSPLSYFVGLWWMSAARVCDIQLINI